MRVASSPRTSLVQQRHRQSPFRVERSWLCPQLSVNYNSLSRTLILPQTSGPVPLHRCLILNQICFSSPAPSSCFKVLSQLLSAPRGLLSSSSRVSSSFQWRTRPAFQAGRRRDEWGRRPSLCAATQNFKPRRKHHK